jgi:hypothetical protein
MILSHAKALAQSTGEVYRASEPAKKRKLTDKFTDADQKAEDWEPCYQPYIAPVRPDDCEDCPK